MHGLGRADAALAAFIDNPALLDRERGRFDSSPPPYRLRESLPSTASQPTPRNETDEQQRLVDWYWRIRLGRTASLPSYQFNAQAEVEYDKLFQPRGGLVGDSYLRDVAKATVKARWQAWGIWGDDWRTEPHGLWRHEQPLSPEPLTDLDSDTEDDDFFAAPRVRKQPPPARTDEEQRQAEERQQTRFAVRAREHELTKPFHQLVSQVSEERERILAEAQTRRREERGLAGQAAEQQDHPNILDVAAYNINTTAYEAVKARWTKSGIWNNQWGVLAGMAWKHEQPLKTVVLDEMGQDNVARLPPATLAGMEDVVTKVPPPPDAGRQRRRRRRRRHVAENGATPSPPLPQPAVAPRFLSDHLPEPLFFSQYQPEAGHQLSGSSQRSAGVEAKYFFQGAASASVSTPPLDNAPQQISQPQEEQQHERPRPSPRRGRPARVEKAQRKTASSTPARNVRAGPRQLRNAAAALAELERKRERQEGVEQEEKEEEHSVEREGAGKQEQKASQKPGTSTNGVAAAAPVRPSPETPRRRSSRLAVKEQAAASPLPINMGGDGKRKRDVGRAGSPVLPGSKPQGVTKTKQKKTRAVGGRKGKAKE